MALGTGPNGDLGRWLPAAAHAGLARFVHTGLQGRERHDLHSPAPARKSVVAGRGGRPTGRGRDVPRSSSPDLRNRRLPRKSGLHARSRWRWWSNYLGGLAAPVSRLHRLRRHGLGGRRRRQGWRCGHPHRGQPMQSVTDDVRGSALGRRPRLNAQTARATKPGCMSTRWRRLLVPMVMVVTSCLPQPTPALPASLLSAFGAGATFTVQTPPAGATGQDVAAALQADNPTASIFERSTTCPAGLGAGLPRLYRWERERRRLDDRRRRQWPQGCLRRERPVPLTDDDLEAAWDAVFHASPAGWSVGGPIPLSSPDQ